MSSPFDRQRLTEIAHGDMPYWNPLAPEQIGRLSGALPLGQGRRVLDVGCGRARLLLEVIERSGATGVGIDANARAIEEGRAAAGGRFPPGAIELRAELFEAGAFERASFDTIMCIGSTHAAGGLSKALEAFADLLAPGGHVLIGEGYWKREPDPDYLSHIGSTRDEMAGLAATLAQFSEAGFTVLDRAVTEDADWDRYEGGYLAHMEAHAALHPGEHGAAAMLAHVRRWNEGYRRWGRITMGFVLVLAMRSPVVRASV